MPPGPIADKIKRLDSRESMSIAELETRIREARAEVARKVARAARERGFVISGRNREKLYGDISDTYLKLDNGLKDWSASLVNGAAVDWHDAAVKDIKSGTGTAPAQEVTKFSREYAGEVFKRVTPEGAGSLVGAITGKMADDDIKALRGAVVEAYRESALTGETLSRIQTAIKQKWDAIAAERGSFSFVDSNGRPWEQARYLQMVVRTTTARVARDSYFDTLNKNGDDLAIVQNADGLACPICTAWDGVIISTTGQSEKYPSYQDALRAGLFHPNCRCMAERVDESLDADESKKQGDKPTPDFKRLEGETEAQYKARMAGEVKNYSADFSGQPGNSAAADLQAKAAADARAAKEAADAKAAENERIRKEEEEDIRKNREANDAAQKAMDKKLADEALARARKAAEDEVKRKAQVKSNPARGIFSTVPPPAPLPEYVIYETPKAAISAIESLVSRGEISYAENRPQVASVLGSKYHKYGHTGVKRFDYAKKENTVDPKISAMGQDALTVTTNCLAELQSECDRLQIPRISVIRNTNAKKYAATMGDGWLTVNSQYFKFNMTDKRFSTWKRGDDVKKRPGTTGGYQAGADGLRNTMYHEFGHHIHQQVGAATAADMAYPVLERRLNKMFKDANYGKNSASVYAEKNAHEWFAENYALAKMKRTDLLDPSKELHDLLREVGAL